MRISTFSTFGRVLLGMQSNQLASLRAQEQLSSGRRILRPSDDAPGTARALALRRETARTTRIQEALGAGRTQLELASSTLQHSSELLSRARELVVQAMNGTLNDDDRATIARELTEIQDQLLDDANLAIDESYVFGGTALGRAPWERVESGGAAHYVYRGNSSEHLIQAGDDNEIPITAAGDQIFGRAVPGAVRFDGLTGVSSGTTADEGSGYAYLVLRNDGLNTGVLGSVGVAPLDGDDRNTLLGVNVLRIDGTAGTVQLGDGPAVTIPGPGERGDVLLRNEKGGELHLDFEGWNGNDYTGDVVGRGSISLDGVNFTTLTFGETNLELTDPELGQVLHIDARGIRRAGKELVRFGETSNPFDLLAGIVDDLENGQGLEQSAVHQRLGERLDDLDRVHDDLLVGLGTIGARTARLLNANVRQEEIGLHLLGRLSEVEDADLAAVAIDLSRSEMILQLAQAAGARVMQTSLLQFLG